MSTQPKPTLKRRIRAFRRREGVVRFESTVFGFLAWVILRAMRALTRLEVVGGEEIFRNWRENVPMVLAFWHGRSIMLPFVMPARPRSAGESPSPGTIAETYIMNSTHRDGEIITRALVRFGVQTTRGSARKGAVAGTLGLMRALRRGHVVALIPDGPKGPPGVAKAGAAELAARSGAPLYPLSFSADRCVRLTGWDRMMFPLPGAKVTCVVGEPLRPAIDRDNADESRESIRAELESALIEVTHRADRAAGRPEEDT